MTSVIRTAEEMLKYVRQAPSLPVDQNKAEVRIYAAGLTGALVFLTAEPILYSWGVPQSVLARIMHVSSLPDDTLLIVNLSALIVTVPHLFILSFLPSAMKYVLPRQLACLAAFCLSVIWLYLAYLAVPMDYGLSWLAYLVRAIGCFVVSLAFAFSVNSQQLREKKAEVLNELDGDRRAEGG